MKEYKGNKISRLVVIMMMLTIISAFIGCAPSQKSFNNSGEACHKYFHKKFKEFDK